MSEQGTALPIRVHMCLLRSAEIQELRTAMRSLGKRRFELAGLTTDGSDAAVHVAASQSDVVIVGAELFPDDAGNGLVAFLTDVQALGRQALVLIEVWDQDWATSSSAWPPLPRWRSAPSMPAGSSSARWRSGRPPGRRGAGLGSRKRRRRNAWRNGWPCHRPADQSCV